MAYFFEIITEGFQPNFKEVTVKHTNALNNYIKYGVASEQKPEGFSVIEARNMPTVARVPLAKPIEVKSREMNTVVNNMNIYMISILCCEDEGDKDEY